MNTDKKCRWYTIVISGECPKGLDHFYIEKRPLFIEFSAYDKKHFHAHVTTPFEIGYEITKNFMEWLTGRKCKIYGGWS